MRKYGGLRHKIPVTFLCMTLGTLAITGVGIPFSYDLIGLPIGFAGFVSKDAIIEGAYASHNAAAGFGFTMLVIAAAFTSFYSWRLVFLTFFGETRDKKHYDHAHESPGVMMWPLYLLSAGAVLAGMVFYYPFIGGESAEDWFNVAIFMGEANHVMHDSHYVPAWVKLSPFVAMLGGLFVAWVMYVKSPSLPRELAERHYGLYKFLLNKWYFDELYALIFVRPAMWIGKTLWKKGRRRHRRRHHQRAGNGRGALLHPALGPGAVGLRLPLCVRDADRHLGPDNLAERRRGGALRWTTSSRW